MPPLVGIARLASLAPSLLEKNSITYSELPTNKWIHRCDNPRMPFQWTINPYRGCEFGCKYCYARYTHEFMEFRDPSDFETRIFAKHLNPSSFRKELAGIAKGQHIALGTATDPYQPAERRYGLTQRILTILGEGSGRTISITTKSDLISRDADLLATVARRNILHVNFTVTTMDAALARKLEPRAPRPDLRMAALQQLAKRGIAAGVFSSPVLPGINDTVASLRAVAQAASGAGAQFFAAFVLFLKPCSAQVFLPFLDAEFPALSARYREQFARGAFLRGEYPEMIRRRVHAIRDELDLASSPVPYQIAAEEEEGRQLSLFA